MEQIKSIPYSHLAEQSVLGAMLRGSDATTQAASIVKSEDFYVKAHAEMFDAIIDLFNHDKPIDIITFTEQLKLRGTFDAIGGLQYIAEVSNAVPTVANLRHHANIVTQKATLRRLITAAEDIAKTGYAGEEEVPNILDYAEQRIFEILEKKDIQGFTHISDVLSINFERIFEMSENPNALAGLPTGFENLDKILNGLHSGNLVLIAARPAMGKTSLALNIAQNVAVKSRTPVAIFSLEMSKEELVNRLWSMETMVELGKIQTAAMDEREFLQLADGMELLSKAPIYIDDSGECTITDMRAKCRRLKRDKGLGLIIVDHLQLMKASRRSENRQQEVTELSRMFKIMAKDLGVPVLVLSQLNRAAEARSGNRPMLSDLRESGAIEQDADVVLLLYREDYYNRDTENPGVAECIIAKHRNGATGTVEFKWLSEYTKFANLDRQHE